MQNGIASQILEDTTMNTLTTHSCTSPSFTAKRRSSLRATLTRGFDLWRSRRALAALTPAQLEDVGVTPREARNEARRPVWDVPHNWHD
jgi:uncharacterized protein YjiS (DUF1127 family)